MTEKLYYYDSDLLEFEAEVKVIKQTENDFQVFLNKTAFYPTSGGQLFDTGELNSIPVSEVILDRGVVVHVLTSKPDFKVGEIVAQRRAKRIAGRCVFSGEDDRVDVIGLIQILNRNRIWGLRIAVIIPANRHHLVGPRNFGHPQLSKSGVVRIAHRNFCAGGKIPALQINDVDTVGARNLNACRLTLIK